MPRSTHRRIRYQQHAARLGSIHNRFPWKNSQSFDLNGLLALQHAVGLAIGKVLDLQIQDVSDRPDDADDIA